MIEIIHTPTRAFEDSGRNFSVCSERFWSLADFQTKLNNAVEFDGIKRCYIHSIYTCKGDKMIYVDYVFVKDICNYEKLKTEYGEILGQHVVFEDDKKIFLLKTTDDEEKSNRYSICINRHKFKLNPSIFNDYIKNSMIRYLFVSKMHDEISPISYYYMGDCLCFCVHVEKNILINTSDLLELYNKLIDVLLYIEKIHDAETIEKLHDFIKLLKF